MLAKSPLCNVGGVKAFSNTPARAFGEERHFAPIDGVRGGLFDLTSHDSKESGRFVLGRIKLLRLFALLIYGLTQLA